MSFSQFSRRSLILSIFALSACQATGADVSTDRVQSSTFDGDYEIYIGRFGRDTSLQRANNEVGTESELARLKVKSVGGRLSLVALQDRTGTPSNYQNLKASFAADGRLTFDAIGNILFDKRETRRLRFTVVAGEQLLAGETVAFLVQDWDEHWAASIRIRKL